MQLYKNNKNTNNNNNININNNNNDYKNNYFMSTNML